MPIDPGEAPQAAIAAAEKAINAPGFPKPASRDAFAKTLERSFPHRVEALSLDQIEQGSNDLRRMTQPRGWRFLVHNGPNAAFAAVRVAAADGNDDYSLGDLSEGRFVAGTEAAVRFAEMEVDGRFEAVLLMAPELRVAVLWLRSLDGGEDFILTMPSSHKADTEPRKSRVMTTAAFLTTMRDLAKAARSRRQESEPGPHR